MVKPRDTQYDKRTYQPNKQTKSKGENQPRKFALSARATPNYHFILIGQRTKLDPFAYGSSAVSISHKQKLPPSTKPAILGMSLLSINRDMSEGFPGSGCIYAHS